MTLLQTPKGALEIRELHTIAEMVTAEEIQRLVWGMNTIPHAKEILIPVQHEGGLLAGAFTPQGDMVGMIFGFPTHDPSVQHSQILATLENWRGLGIGAGLKWYQRQWCLQRGIRLVRWTVDPLRAANAELNIRHLGGHCSTYYPDYYGAMQGIDAGAPSDRLLIEWQLDSARVVSRALQTPPDCGFPNAQPVNEMKEDQPPCINTGLSCPEILIRLPENFIQVSSANPALALSWRWQTRELIQHYFASGFTITGFTRVGGPAYLLERNLIDEN